MITYIHTHTDIYIYIMLDQETRLMRQPVYLIRMRRAFAFVHCSVSLLVATEVWCFCWRIWCCKASCSTCWVWKSERWKLDGTWWKSWTPCPSQHHFRMSCTHAHTHTQTYIYIHVQVGYHFIHWLSRTEHSDLWQLPRCSVLQSCSAVLAFMI